MQYQVGDWVRIFKKPSSWTSEFNDNCPLKSDSLYPFEGQITKLEYDYNSRVGYHPAEIGNYGWSLDVLINNNNIELIKKSNTSKSEDYKYLVKLFKKLKIK